MIKKLTFIIILILSFGIISCFMQNSFKLKIDSYEYVITANNINDTFKAIIDNNTYDMTPLVYASFSGNVPLAKFSIKSGADINAKDENGSTALIVATTNGNLEIIKLLSQERGLEVNAQDDRGWTALMLALNSKQSEKITNYLMEKGGVIDFKKNNKKDNGAELLLYNIINWSIINSGNLKMIDTLIRNSADEDIKKFFKNIDDKFSNEI